MSTTDQPLHRFDGAFHWTALPVEAQVAIGAVALEIAVAWRIQSAVMTGGVPKLIERAADAADALLIGQLQELVGTYLPPAAAVAPDRMTPRIPSLLGGVCRRCGCSWNDACRPNGCTWIAEDICSACVLPKER